MVGLKVSKKSDFILTVGLFVAAAFGPLGMSRVVWGAESLKADKAGEKVPVPSPHPTTTTAPASTAPATTGTATGTATGVSSDTSTGTAIHGSNTPKEGAVVAPPSPTAGTVVEIKTTVGSIKVELADREAPVSVKNFLAYINDKFYDGLIFHRVIKDFMIQGGGYAMVNDKLVEKATKPPIANEAKNGLKNMRGTIAMARTQDPNSATAQFFINHVNNNNLDYPSFDGHGYAVFGKVIEGLDVVDKIAMVKTGVKGGMPDVPLTDVKIISMQLVKAASH